MSSPAIRTVFAGFALALVFSSRPAAAGPATAILVLEHVRADGRVWDFGPGADPVICLKAGCYRSTGNGTAAQFFPRHEALAFGDAGACSNSFSCIFRHIEVDQVLTSITPVDVDVVRHDGMENRLVSLDQGCAVENGELKCPGGTFTSEYSLWLIPDAIADAAGPDGLRAAAVDGIARARGNASAHFLASEQNGLADAARDFYRLVLAEQISDTCRNDPSVILATFELTGLVKRRDQVMLQLLHRYLAINDPRDLQSFIAGDPLGFWRLHDAIDRLHLMSSAESVQRIGYDAGGIALDTDNGASVLHVDPDVEARARAVIDRCQDGLDVWSGLSPVAEGFISDPPLKKKVPPLTPADVSKRIAKSLPRINPDNSPERAVSVPKTVLARPSDQKKANMDLDAETIQAIIGKRKIFLP